MLRVSAWTNDLTIPDDFDYATVKGLSNEMREKLGCCSSAESRSGLSDRGRDASCPYVDCGQSQEDVAVLAQIRRLEQPQHGDLSIP
jgi:hypothetical protein